VEYQGFLLAFLLVPEIFPIARGIPLNRGACQRPKQLAIYRVEGALR
jgi:hypothetical protein